MNSNWTHTVSVQPCRRLVIVSFSLRIFLSHMVTALSSFCHRKGQNTLWLHDRNTTDTKIRYETRPLKDTCVFWHYSEFLLQLCGSYLLRQDVPPTKDPPLSSRPLPEQDVSGHPASSGLFLCYRQLLLADKPVSAEASEDIPIHFINSLRPLFTSTLKKW